MATSKPLILITGKDGQLGKSLQDVAIRFKQFEFLFTGKEILNLTDKENVHQFFEKNKPAFCINTAAFTAVDLAETEREQAFLVNATAVSNLAKTCEEFNCLLLHISTDYVFSGEKNTRYAETDISEPVNYYGVTKKAGEEFALQECKKTIIIRTSWLYSKYGKNFVKTMLHLFATRDEIAVVGDQFGSPTYANELAVVLLKICSQVNEKNDFNAFGMYHYSDAGNISWYDFAMGIKKLSGTACSIRKITTKEYLTPAKRPAYAVFNTSKLERTFGLQIKNWEENLAECLKNLHA
ncbi:MAG: dTDP-4-dehydrorhamnose reductase [Chitinophagaceae bacterium]